MRGPKSMQPYGFGFSQGPWMRGVKNIQPQGLAFLSYFKSIDIYIKEK